MIGNDRISLLPNGSLEIGELTTEDNGEYWCYASNPTGEVKSRVAHVSIVEPPSGKIWNGKTICPIFFESLSIKMSRSTTLSAWFKDGVELDIENDPGKRLKENGELEFVTRQRSDAGRYYFTATNEVGTVKSNEVEVIFISKSIRI